MGMLRHLSPIDLEYIALYVPRTLRRRYALHKRRHSAAARHLPEHQAKAVDVAPHIGAFPAKYLRGYVARRTANLSACRLEQT